VINSDSILKEGKENLSSLELKRARELQSENLCEIQKYQYIDCVDSEDNDYFDVTDPDCPGQIQISPSDNKCRCPVCGRDIYLSDKKLKEKTKITLDTSGIYTYVRDEVKNALDCSVGKKQNGLKYYNKRIEPVFEADTNSQSVSVHIIFEHIPRNIIKWLRIYDRSSILVLVDEGLSCSDELARLNIPYLTIGDIVDDDSSETIKSEYRKLTERGPLVEIEKRASLALEMCESDSVLENMGWSDFEHCVDSMLKYSVGTSHIYGGTEPGTGVPDGTLTLNWPDNNCLYMWDAKFVDLTKNEETDLSDEYSKIFRHLTELNAKQQTEPIYNEIHGICLFSPGIAETSITRLAEFIQEQNLPSNAEWKGSICYFELNALSKMTQMKIENRSNIKQKMGKFESALYQYLSTPAKHSDEPEVIADSQYRAVHIGPKDIEEIFEYLSDQSKETFEFDKNKHMEYLQFNFSLSSE